MLIKPAVLTLTLLAILAGCGGSSSEAPPPVAPTPTPDPVATSDITGGGVKGPLAGAIVSVYLFDPTQVGFKGALVDDGVTNAASAITGVSLPLPLTPPYIMEFTSDGSTTDITTGLPPVIQTLRTVITQALINTGEQIYATPLTTMAVDIAVKNAPASPNITQFETALTAAASQVVSTLGFGMSGAIDIFDVPPLVDSTTDTPEEQANVASYRSAVEALTAVVFTMNQQSSTNNVDSVLSELSNDLSDGIIDGSVDGTASSVITSTALNVLTLDPATLPIPNSPTNQTVGDVQAILVSETASTGSTVATTQLDTGGSINTQTTLPFTNPDVDSDGIFNASDNCLNISNATQTNTDGQDDGGDACDTDDDNDTILDDVDNCPLIANVDQTNTDGQADGGDACDTDDDDDGTLDINDAFPLNPAEQTDTDGDGKGNVEDLDDDNDGISDIVEDASGNSADHDGDGIPNREDTDSDNDGAADNLDFAPYDNTIGINAAPISANIVVNTNEDTAAPIVLIVTDDGVAPGALVYSVSTPSSGVLTGTAPNLTYTPNAQFNGQDSITYSATDGGGLISNAATITVNVSSVNDVPVIAQTGPLTVNMDEDASPTAFVAPTITATDLDGDTLTWSGTAATSGTATVSGVGISPIITYVPNANFNGSDSFDVSVGDGNGGSQSITIDVNIAAQNDVPTIGGTPDATVVEGIGYSFTPTANDVDGDSLSFTIQNQPSWITSFSTTTGAISGTPGTGDVGGSFTNIIISVVTTNDTVALTAFSITVQAAPAGGAVWDNFNWDDGSTWQ